MSYLPNRITTILPPLPDGWYLQGFSVLSKGRLALIGADVDVEATRQAARQSAQNGQARQLYQLARQLATQATARVWVFHDGEVIDGPQFPMLEPIPLIDEFPDGRWLVANERSQNPYNARILAVDGKEERRIELGDCIEHIKIDDRNRIWVGWFDEGIFGQSWQFPGCEYPTPAVYGIAAFDDRGAVIAHATDRSISDCSALNVFDDEAWACTGWDFPIWQMCGGHERIWPTNLNSFRAITDAIAVRHPYVLAAGLSRDANHAVLLRLDGRATQVLGEWRLAFGVPARAVMLDGRGDELHIVHGRLWHRWRVADIIKSK